MVFCEVLVPCAILVVVPVVIIPVPSIVNADLKAGLLGVGMAMIESGAAKAAVRKNDAM